MFKKTRKQMMGFMLGTALLMSEATVMAAEDVKPILSSGEPVLAVTMMNDTFSVNDIQKERSSEEMEELNDLQKEMDDLCEKENFDENEYKDLNEEIINQELECEVYNFQEEVELRIATVKTAIEDMKRDKERGGS
ncbi:MAG: hypothetical protein LUH14_07550 [Clostridiaceae bacterium]|nr:hypothetical protein [Clostridiaceae bacterium]